MTEREFAISVVKRLHEAGYEALWAGGCVRDELLGRKPEDYDIATNALPEQVRKLFRRSIAVGASFGVIEVLGPKPLTVEVATFRSDVSYSDGRHPDAVIFSTAQDDALRRDFTINGMFFDPLNDRLIDFVGGQGDLRAKVLRAIGKPPERFREDKLRLLRGVRIATCFDLEIEPVTAAAIKAMAGEITVVSAERIAEELRKLLLHSRRARGVELLRELGLIAALLPELLPMVGLPQGPPAAPTGDLWEHVLRVLDLLGEGISFPLALAALLHDVGKPRTVGRTPDRYTFYYHEHVGARLASDISLRLKLSNDDRARIAWLVEKHIILCDARQMRTSKLKPLLAHPGIGELLALHRADARAWGKSEDHVDYCEFLLNEWTDADLNPPAILTGHDLTRHGLEPGPKFKLLLDAVREAQLDGQVKDKQQALELVDRLLAEQQ
ncbi:MAG: CCA tRNA nucleotidyltransferase [Planctomycetes bacterium]|nr:CCA tRNA nucleotidyltransferase [Planctomycetota bacterium]